MTRLRAIDRKNLARPHVKMTNTGWVAIVIEPADAPALDHLANV
jgi:hypothetical protein